MPDFTLSAKITGDASGFESAVKNAEKSASGFEKTMNTLSRKMSSVGKAIQSAGEKITKVTGAFAGIAAIGVKYNATMETYATSFEVMTGSAEKAAEVVDELKEIASATPFEMPELAETTQLLMQYGFTADDALNRMQMLGDISQGSADKMQRIAMAYGQMSSAGKVSLEDIKQMIEAGFNPLQEISESTGESMESLYDRISAGTISVDEITASMQRSTSEGGKYFQSMEKQSQTFSGQLSTLKDNVQSLLGNVTSGIFEKLAQEVLPKLNEVVGTINSAFEEGGFQGALDAIGQMSPVLDGVITRLQTFSTFLQNLGIDPSMFAGIVAAAGPALIIIGKLTTGVSGFIGALGRIGPALSGLSPVVLIIGAIAGAFAYLMTTNDAFRTSIMGTVSSIAEGLAPTIEQLTPVIQQLGELLLGTISSALNELAPLIAQIVDFVGQLFVALAPIIAQLIEGLMPILQTLSNLFLQIIQTILPVIMDLLSQLMPVILQIVEIIGNLLSQIMPLIAQLVERLAPVIEKIIESVAEIITTLMPPLMDIINMVIGVIEDLMPPIMKVVEIVFDAVSQIIDAIMPIIEVVTEIITTIIEIISPIIEVVTGIISEIVEFISPLIDVFATIFGAIFDVVGEVFGAIGDVIGGVFKGIQNAWNGLTSFVGGIVDGIGSAFNSLVNGVKSVINGVISAINGAIWVINLIPGVNIGSIPYLAHGTENWQGGFAYMNEGGRGELTYLPNGSQVIPHDISVQYAKEAARANASAEPIDLTGVLEGIVIQVFNNTTVDGTPLRETVSDYTIRKIGNQQKAMLRSRGAYA